MITAYYNNVALGAKEDILWGLNDWNEDRVSSSATNWNVYKPEMLDLYIGEIKWQNIALRWAFRNNYNPIDYVDFNYKGEYGSSVINAISLDDDKEFISDIKDYIPIVSSTLSRATAPYTYSSPLTLNLAFNQKTYISNGITVKFQDYYATKVRIVYSYFDGTNTTTISDKFYTDCNSLTYFFDNGEPTMTSDGIGYNRVTITFIQSQKPKQLMKILTVDFGELIEINDFFSLSTSHEAKIDGSDLPIGSCEFNCKIDKNIEGEDGQAIDIYQDEKYINRYYINKIERTGENRYSFSGDDCLSVLDDIQSYKMYDNPKSEVQNPDWEDYLFPNDGLNMLAESGYRITTLTEDIIEFTGIQIDNNNIDKSTSQNSLGDVIYADSLIGFIDGKKSLRYLLLQSSFMCNCVAFTEKNIINLKRYDIKSISSTISADRIIGKATVEKKKPISAIVNLVWNKYINSDTGQVIYEGLGTGEKQTIVLDKKAFITNYTNCSNLKNKMYCVSFIGTQGANVKLVGEKYNYNDKNTDIIVTQVNERISENIKEYKDYCLRPLTKTELDNKLSKISNVNKSYKIIKAKILLEDEHLMDYVTIDTAYSGTFSGFITKMNTTYSNNKRFAEVELSVV